MKFPDTLYDHLMPSPCRHCGNKYGFVEPAGNRHHAAKVTCTHCRKFQKWLSKRDTAKAKQDGIFNESVPMPMPWHCTIDSLSRASQDGDRPLRRITGVEITYPPRFGVELAYLRYYMGVDVE